MYTTPDDLDLWTAGVSERPMHGSMVGPVFGCIIGETFRDLRLGDRYWYENPDQPSSFTKGQLTTRAKIIAQTLFRFQTFCKALYGIFDISSTFSENCRSWGHVFFINEIFSLV